MIKAKFIKRKLSPITSKELIKITGGNQGIKLPTFNRHDTFICTFSVNSDTDLDHEVNHD